MYASALAALKNSFAASKSPSSSNAMPRPRFANASSRWSGIMMMHQVPFRPYDAITRLSDPFGPNPLALQMSQQPLSARCPFGLVDQSAEELSRYVHSRIDHLLDVS